MKTTLFILKRGNELYPNMGLSSAASLTSKAIQDSEVAYAVDGNSIDGLITLHKPKIAVLEAVWVTPEKINELQSLHPDVMFIVRIHSKVEFLAEEGQVFDWLYRYNCTIASNHRETSAILSDILNKEVLYLPNVYPKPNVYCGLKNREVFKVSCFGASRILKSQLSQAIAAIRYADTYNKNLEFHINTAETQIIKNIRSLFKHSPYTLVEHDWLDSSDLLYLISTMDLGMQVSLTETFNLVTADHIWQSVPMVTSSKIDWLDNGIFDPYNIDEIVEKMRLVTEDNPIESQLYNLILYNFDAIDQWKDLIQ